MAARAHVARAGAASPVKISRSGAADRGAMAANESLDAIIAALGAILMAAPQRERQRLAQAIEHYAARFPTAYRDMRNGHPAPALRELIQEVIEAVDARPE